jgi:hypothetical protein
MPRTLSDLAGGGTVFSAGGVLLAWAPTDTNLDHGGPDTLNPLLNADGSSAISPDYPEGRSMGPDGVPAVTQSVGIANRQAWRAHDRGGVRRVNLTWDAASGVDVELVRRACQVTGSGAGRTRWRDARVDGIGPVETAPWWRIVPGVLKLSRIAGASAAKMTLTLEYVCAGVALTADEGGGGCTACADFMATQAHETVDGQDAIVLIKFDGTLGAASTGAKIALAKIVGANICGLSTNPEDVVMYAVGYSQAFDVETGEPGPEYETLPVIGTDAQLQAVSEDYGYSQWTLYFRCADQELGE